ncbi:hypothetical protein [Anaerolentibacter hominis]|uniref:hypothetical protein n=1 Tax=Anaerolentibacter hominis TaxID=3079009 RepID=UPI0031B82EF7
MKNERLLYAIGNINEKFISEAEPGPYGKRIWKRSLILAAAALLALALCGFTAYKLGWFDPWQQSPSADPEEVVRHAIENQMDKDYTISVRVDEVKVDKNETARAAAMYSGSELAGARGWTEEYLAEHFIAVRANYYVEYDHTKTFLDDGDTQQYFYLIQDAETGEWTIVENTSPNTGT